MKTQQSKRIKQKVLRKQVSTTNSITCGTENPASLGCVFYELEGGEAATIFRCSRWHEGHEGIMHGGMSAAVLDEVMASATGVYVSVDIVNANEDWRQAQMGETLGPEDSEEL